MPQPCMDGWPWIICRRTHLSRRVKHAIIYACEGSMGRTGETPVLLSCEKVAARCSVVRTFRFREQQRTTRGVRGRKELRPRHA
jgi:hypothetical protein